MIGFAMAMALAAATLLQAQAGEEVVVTATPTLDAQRLADALRAYLDGVGVRVEARAPGETDDPERRTDPRAPGDAVRAVALVRTDRKVGGSVQIELIDLATRKALIVTVPRPARDEDLYRALALKIQAAVRANRKEDPDGRDGDPAIARVDSVNWSEPPPTRSPRAPTRLGLDVGYSLVTFPIDGALFDGLAARVSSQPNRRLELSLGTAALRSVSLSSGGIDAIATVVPVRATAGLRIGWRLAEVLIGPCAEAAWTRISLSSTTATVRSARHLIFALGGEAEIRVVFLTLGRLFARGAMLAVLNGERYEIAGSPILDTSRLEASATIGVGVGLP